MQAKEELEALAETAEPVESARQAAAQVDLLWAEPSTQPAIWI
jgi:hypothetical protein